MFRLCTGARRTTCGCPLPFVQGSVVCAVRASEGAVRSAGNRLCMGGCCGTIVRRRALFSWLCLGRVRWRPPAHRMGRSKLLDANNTQHADRELVQPWLSARGCG